MNLANETILVRAFLGSLLGVLATFGVVRFAPEDIEAILTLGDNTLALLPTVFALAGTLSARFSVDGPETADEKAREIVRLEAMLDRLVSIKPPEKPQ